MMFMVRKAPTPMLINSRAASHSSLCPCFT